MRNPLVSRPTVEEIVQVIKFQSGVAARLVSDQERKGPVQKVGIVRGEATEASAFALFLAVPCLITVDLEAADGSI